MADVPVACRLSGPELRARESGLLANLAAQVLEREPLPSGSADSEGLRLRFAATAELLAEVAQLIALERQCCPFLRFSLTVEPAGGPLWLELSGPPGTRSFLETPALGRAGSSGS